ncbi:acyl carrier protein [Streptomyces sp. NBC_01261]|uniref:acyl carrier protein n=1 Tax=unclassified Streptomyces TaxID=2593676 RepID=UPI002E2A9B0B|nr:MULTISPECIES: acyl carrier protein [unclassified Streptomyces]
MSETDVMVSPAEIPGLVCTLVRLVAPQKTGTVGPDHRLVQDLGFHSLALAELGFTIEDLFRLEALTPEVAMSLERVADVIRLIGGHVDDGSITLPSHFEVNSICARYGTTWSPEGR